MSLPIVLSQSKDLNQMQTLWASQLDKLLSNPLLNGIILQKVNLGTGTNTINHLLGRKLQGWYITRQRGPASIYDSQDANAMPQLTLVLVSSGAVEVDLYVF